MKINEILNSWDAYYMYGLEDSILLWFHSSPKLSTESLQSQWKSQQCFFKLNEQANSKSYMKIQKT